MRLLDVVRRQGAPEPWAEGEKIPWHEPDFSRRMLNMHLSQEHDAASRRFEIIDGHCRWIHGEILKGRPARILDLGCGPGLHTSRLTRLGHGCVGIDISPASIAYAREQAEEEGLACTYVQGDIRTADYGAGYGLLLQVAWKSEGDEQPREGEAGSTGAVVGGRADRGSTGLIVETCSGRIHSPA